MKPQRVQRSFGALMTIGALMASFESHAVSARPHAMRGVIESIDHMNRTVTVVSTSNGESRIFVWNDSTRFRQKGKKVSAETLQGGITVRGYYRKEIGRLVLREVRLNKISLSNGVPHRSVRAFRYSGVSSSVTASVSLEIQLMKRPFKSPSQNKKDYYENTN